MAFQNNLDILHHVRLFPLLLFYCQFVEKRNHFLARLAEFNYEAWATS
jgi:hypothetical protein